jgi:hypothetical protein
MKKLLALKIITLIFVSAIISLFLTHFEYGHNIWNRYCKEPSAFNTKPVCIEAALKKDVNSEEFQREDYFYLSIKTPFIGSSQDIKNPSLGSSVTISQWGYALTSPHFYLSFVIISVIIAVLYFLLTKLFARKPGQ